MEEVDAAAKTQIATRQRNAPQHIQSKRSRAITKHDCSRTGLADRARVITNMELVPETLGPTTLKFEPFMRTLAIVRGCHFDLGRRGRGPNSRYRQWTRADQKATMLQPYPTRWLLRRPKCNSAPALTE